METIEEIEVTNTELNKLFISKFPNLKEKCNDEVSWQEGDNTGSHVVFGDVLVPYLLNCIKSIKSLPRHCHDQQKYEMI